MKSFLNKFVGDRAQLPPASPFRSVFFAWLGGFLAIALVTLALGIGATTAIFTVDYAALIADIQARGLQRWRQSEDNSGKNRQAGGKSKNSGIEADALGAGHARNRETKQRIQAERGERQAERASRD